MNAYLMFGETHLLTCKELRQLSAIEQQFVESRCLWPAAMENF